MNARLVLALLLLCASPVFAQQATPPLSPPLKQLLDEQYDFLMREDPLRASTRGDMRFNDQLRDESPAACARRLEEEKQRLAKLQALDRKGFSEEDSLDADLLEYELKLAIDGAALHNEQMPINAMDGPHIWLPQMCDSIPLRTAQQYRDYTKRLTRVGALIDQEVEQMREGLKAGRVPPKVVLSRAVREVQAQASAEIEKDPTTSPFYKPFVGGPAAHNDLFNDATALAASDAIKSGITPAFARLAKFLQDEYIPKCRETIGISAGVDGPAAYAFLLRSHTTVDMTPQQVHELGEREVARIRAQMLACIDETDWPEKTKYTVMTPPPRTSSNLDRDQQNDHDSQVDVRFAAFLQYLRTNPRFYYTSEDDLLRGYRDIAKRIDAELPRLFKTLPRNTYGVRPIPRFAAPSSPAAYCYNGSIRSGIPGYFTVNTYDLSRRPKYSMISLTCHEAVPGHHLQLSIADELEGVHPFRTLTNYTAYVEGWALYSEGLGLEMSGSDIPHPTSDIPHRSRGFYQDPYDYFGRLSDEVWRACRLVVDTGMHSMNWSRQQAIDYMLANTAGTEADTISEVDRYISWPGQACAYKIGELKIKELRARAEKALGDKFDLRSFHDAILGGGVLPLPVLEKRIDRWIQAQVK